jgi:hypothetical protein
VYTKAGTVLRTVALDFFLPLYMFLHSLLNVLVQITNEMGLQTKKIIVAKVAVALYPLKRACLGLTSNRCM